jgi:hypothetical protein
MPLSWYSLHDYRWDSQAYEYTVVAFHPKSKGIVIYIFPKDGSGKGIIFNINHDIIPQVIGKTLAGVSREENK